jgi:zinc protease
MDIPFVKGTLSNGMDVIVHEDHRIPIVAVNLWYHVGSKNEEPGFTGFAHLFEHLMFEGSAHHDRGYFQPLQEAGASLNGSTNADRTNYWQVVPSNAVELALWLESDRLGYLLPALTPAKFDNQRHVVLNERRQNYENRPYGMAGMALVETLYPPDHPYHWLTIGSAADLQTVTLKDAQTFFERFYHPANASLALAGDIATDEGFDLARHYFEEIPPRPAPVVPDAHASLSAEVRLVMEDRVELPRVYLAWHSPGLFGPADAELDLLADVLAHGKTSRLSRTLIYDRQLAVDVSATQNSRELGGFFQIGVTAAPGSDLATLRAGILGELERLAGAGPTESELERSVAQFEAEFLYRLQCVGGFGGKSDQLNAYNTFLKDPDFFERDLSRYRAATIQGVKAAASTYLTTRPHVCLSVVPHGRLEWAVPDSRPTVLS